MNNECVEFEFNGSKIRLTEPYQILSATLLTQIAKHGCAKGSEQDVRLDKLETRSEDNGNGGGLGFLRWRKGQLQAGGGVAIAIVIAAFLLFRRDSQSAKLTRWMEYQFGPLPTEASENGRVK